VPLNLEIKARITNLDAARDRAVALPSRECGHLLQVDTYFATNRGMLKLREIHGAAAELIFYRREESTHRRVSAFERCPVPDPALLKSLLSESLGVRGVVRKDRHLYLFRERTRIHLDSVERLGSFIEFEVPVTDEAAAEEELDLLLSHFGIRAGEFVNVSYIDLLGMPGRG